VPGHPKSKPNQLNIHIIKVLTF